MDKQADLEQIKALRNEMAEVDREYESGKPTSKVGRDLYYSKFGVFGALSALFELAGDWLNPSGVWYSSTGWKRVGGRKWKRF